MSTDDRSTPTPAELAWTREVASHRAFNEGITAARAILAAAGSKRRSHQTPQNNVREPVAPPPVRPLPNDARNAVADDTDGAQ